MDRVLIVVDTAKMTYLFHDMMENCGLEVIGEARSAEDAVRLYRELKPDIVIMGIDNPDRQGLEALEMLKALDINARVIVLSALKQELFIRTAVEKGASALIIHPLTE